nr:isoform 2 of fbd-associated f-box protein [Quercus suber]
MATESVSKRGKYAEVDRISILPDSLICHSLSFLTTKEAVATTLLTEATLDWTMVPFLDFKEDNLEVLNTKGNMPIQILYAEVPYSTF